MSTLADSTPQTHLRKRYRSDAQPAPAAWNATLDTLLAHRSVRRYLPQPLPDGALEAALAAAQSASSSSNLQAWSVVAVADPARKERINAVAGRQRHITGAPLLLVWLADLARLRAIAGSHDSPGAALDYFEMLLLGVIDAALAAQNAVAAFDSMGLGTCYIGAIRNHPEAVAAELGLPPEVMPVFGMTVGVPDLAAAEDVKPRLPQAAVLHREQYQGSLQTEHLAHYDTVLRDFQAEQGMPAGDWTKQVSKRIQDGAALHGRDRLLEAVRALGFKVA